MLVAFLYLMSNFLGPVNQLVNVGGLLQETEGDMGRIDDVLNYEISDDFKETAENDTPNDDDNQSSQESIDTNTPEFFTGKLTGYLEIRNVTFGYNPTMPALIEDFNLKLIPGKRVALVGGSGSGKSTVARLVAGLYNPWEGEILFDNRVRKDIPRHIITESVAVIDQEVLMFEGTVKENISFWDTHITDHDIIQSAHDADIHETIALRTNAYDNMVSERGANFSGGQRQRLEIARALALNPSILVMDEATSALDPKSEKIVMDNIKKRGCTSLIVAHRLSTILDCDEIIVMDKGKIVERGSHQELIANDGVYADLIDSK
jgi:ABC-type bacteriocin/lantibiotic exporter with double-glycine peptidase domain